MAAIAGLALAATTAPAHAAPGAAIDFSADGYVLGATSPVGQNGWVSGPPPAQYDWALVEGSAFPDATLGDSVRALRFSNWTNGNSPYGNITQLSSPVIDEAGESSTGAASNTFVAEFTVESATGALQPGLNVEVNVDKTGSRAGGGVALRHVPATEDTPAALEITGRWVDPAATSAAITDWRTEVVNVDPTVPHTIRYVAKFLDDAADEVEIYVDGELAITGTTWEGYHRAVGSPAQTVNSLLFRTSRSAPSADGIGYVVLDYPTEEVKAALQGKGFLFSGITYGTKYLAPTSTLVSVNDATFGEAPRAQVFVTADGSPTTGQAAITVDGEPVGTAAIAAGKAWVTLPADLSVGEHTVVASFLEDESSLASSATTTFDVTPAATATYLSLSDSNPTVGQAGLTAYVIVNGTPAPAGDVEVALGDDLVETVALTSDANGRTTVALPAFTTPGDYSLTAKYLGSSTHTASEADVLNFTVASAPAGPEAPGTVIKTVTKPRVGTKSGVKVQKKRIQAGKTRAKVRVRVKATSGKKAPAGVAVVYVNGKAAKIVKLKRVKTSRLAQGTVRLATFSKAGKAKIRVRYFGDATYKASKSKVASVKVRKSAVKKSAS